MAELNKDLDMLLFRFHEKGGVFLCVCSLGLAVVVLGWPLGYRTFLSERESWGKGTSLLLARQMKSKTPVTLNVCCSHSNLV